MNAAFALLFVVLVRRNDAELVLTLLDGRLPCSLPPNLPIHAVSDVLDRADSRLDRAASRWRVLESCVGVVVVAVFE